MNSTTVLNNNHTHLSIVSWQRGIVLLLKDKAIALEYYDKSIQTINGDIILIPKVIVLNRYVKVPDRIYRPNRRNIFIRDNYMCAYCLKELTSEEISVDHIIPKSKGGKETWTNLITACKNCNCKKGNRTPEEAGMKILTTNKFYLCY